ncbi:hypothetical protein ABPG75_006525 [Micractinium tetrahymenae]
MVWSCTAMTHMQAAGATSRLPATACRRRCRHVPPVRASAAPPSSSGSSGGSTAACSSLDCSLRLAAVRAAEQRQEFPLFADAFSAPALAAVAAAAAEQQQHLQQLGAEAAAEAAAAVASAAAAAAADPAAAAGSIAALLSGGDAAQAAREALATRFLDEQLLKAVTIVNMERDLTQEYNQVVLVGDAFDTRPFRLPWPEGTVIFCAAPAAAHAVAEAAFKAQGAHVPRGCLLRRVPAELVELEGAAGAAGAADGLSAGLAAALERAGFRGDRLSAWVLQGLACHGLGPAGLTSLLTDLCNLAAFDSLVAGLLPPLERRRLDNLLASFGLLGAGVDFGEQTDWGRWAPELALDPAGFRPWLFVAQQKRLSLREMGIYEDHVAAAMDAGEDFEGNFS